MKTNSTCNALSLIDNIITTGINKGILHLTTGDESIRGNILNLSSAVSKTEKTVVTFGSCSYLGLEQDVRLREASKIAIDQYGTFFSSSRAYVSSRHYQELEGLFMELSGAFPVITPTTTLAHMSAIPVLVGEKDAIILDHQVHNSVSTAVNLVKTRGTHVELLRHNRMDILEEKIRSLKQSHEQIWYMADGIYSMYGDSAPLEQIRMLLDKYPEFHFYVDDAHGMSCFGRHGRGYALSKEEIHERMTVAVSLAKGFGSGGAALLFANEELARKVRTCGGPLITSGPMQPAVLGAAIASAHIHLSNEIYTLQQSLTQKIKYATHLIQSFGLPLISGSNSAIFFIGVSLPKLGYTIVQRMMNSGYYLNLGVFPAVPMKNTGIRFTLTALHTFEQIETMIQALAYHFHEVLKEEHYSLSHIYKEFKIQAPLEQKLENILHSMDNRSQLVLEHSSSILDINQEEWDMLFFENTNYNWKGLALIESAYKGNPEPENNWDFDYLTIKDNSGKTILATFLTTALCKDDMLASGRISDQIEHERAKNPYYLTSRLLSTGNLLSAGKHMYIDRSSTLWKEAFELFLEKLSALQSLRDANSVLLRDFNPRDIEMDLFLADNAYFKIALPDNHEIINFQWKSQEEYLQQLGESAKRSKRYIKQDVFRHMHKFDVEWLNYPFGDEINYLYELYLEVHNKSKELNTFPLPVKLFEEIAKSKDWEIMTLTLKPEWDQRGKRKPVAVAFNYINGRNYHFMFVGLDYAYQKEHKPYKQAIFQVIERARQLNVEKLILGYTADHVKQTTFCSKPIPSVGYIFTRDTYSMEVISSINTMDSSIHPGHRMAS